MIFDRIPLHFLAIPPFHGLFPVGFPYSLQIPHFPYCREIPLRVAAFIKIDELEKDREENLEIRTQILQNDESKSMKEKIQREVGIIQNAEISDRKPLHKIQNNRENQLKICTGNNALKDYMQQQKY